MYPKEKRFLLTVPNKVSKNYQHEVSSVCIYMSVLNFLVIISSVPIEPVRVAQSVERLTKGPGLDTRSRYIILSPLPLVKGSYRLLAKVCALGSG